MRGRGQIAELCRIAEPDVGAITNIGPVHLELLGTLEAIAEAKAELLAGLPGERPGRGARPTPRRSSPTSTTRLVTITFGAGGDVFALDVAPRRALARGHDRDPRTESSGSGSRSRRRTTSRTPSPRSRSGSRWRRRSTRWRVGRRG